MSQNRQPGDQIVDVINGLGDAAQSVFPELGILVVHRQVLQHQRKGGSCILQVVHKEGRHCLKRFQLFSLRQALR